MPNEFKSFDDFYAKVTSVWEEHFYKCNTDDTLIGHDTEVYEPIPSNYLYYLMGSLTFLQYINTNAYLVLVGLFYAGQFIVSKHVSNLDITDIEYISNYKFIVKMLFAGLAVYLLQPFQILTINLYLFIKTLTYFDNISTIVQNQQVSLSNKLYYITTQFGAYLLYSQGFDVSYIIFLDCIYNILH